MQQLEHNWNTQLYNDKHAFVYDYGVSLIELLNPKSNERILDLGCGSGELSYNINELCSEVIGLDKSQEMIQNAIDKFPLVDFQVGNASDFNFNLPFDAIFSNAALHWVTNYREAIKCMRNNLKEGGRLVVEFGGKDNVKTITNQLRKSLLKRNYRSQSELALWYFPSIGQYTSALESEGLMVTFAKWYDRPTELADEDSGIKDWLRMFGKPFFKGVKGSDVEQIMTEIQDCLKPALFSNGKWYADYKRIRVVAHKQKLI